MENYTTPGWYLIAADADNDGHTWAIRPVKITPEQAEAITDAMPEPTSTRAVEVVRSQNRDARQEAIDANERAEYLAAEAALRAADLAEWRER